MSVASALRALFAAGLIALLMPVVGCAAAAAETLAATGWIDWNGADFFKPCHGDCSVTVTAGKEVTTSMTNIFFVEYPPAPINKWHWRNSDFAGAAFSRRLVTFFGGDFRIDPELGAGQRFDEMHATEFWGALNFRWMWFPWNNYVRTSVGIADGLSVVTTIDHKELTLNKPPAGSLYLNYFSPSITFGVPAYPEYDLILGWHHRSGVFGLIDGVHKGAQFFTAGLRANF